MRLFRIVRVSTVELAFPQEAAIEMLGLPDAAGQFLARGPVVLGDHAVIDHINEFFIGSRRLVGERRGH
jgi:hypothetical protein